MNKKTASKVIEILSGLYPNAKPALIYNSNYELLVAVMLSAQCTDERVNIVTKELFKEYNTPRKMLKLTVEELSLKIKPCGLNNSKAKNIISASKMIVENHGGEVPSDFESLIKLSGVGRKTADVMLAVAFEKDAIAVDTHVFRVSNRIGLVKTKTPYQTEIELMKIIDKSKWSKSHHYLIWHGRRVCKARKPECATCQLKEICKYKDKNL
jgi:endonuclease-3